VIIGARVKELLIANGFSQAELARRVGLAQPTIYGLIHSNKIGSKHLHRIARELRTTPDYLEGRVDDPDEGADTGKRLSSEHLQWLELFEYLTPEQRRNIRAIARDLARGNPAVAGGSERRDEHGMSDHEGRS